jgi:ferredoxin
VPTIHYRGREIECEDGAVLRDALKDAGEAPHNGRADLLNCRGMSTCGTCAVEVEGDVSERNSQERRRLSFPPHELEDGLRLACQTRVHGDVTVVKYDGFWGQHVEDSDAAGDAVAADETDVDDA